MRQREPKGFGKFAEGVNLGGRGIFKTFQPLHMAISQVGPFGKFFLSPPITFA